MSEIKRVVGRPAKAEAYLWDGKFKALPASWRALGVFSRGDDGVLLIRTNRGEVECRLGEHIIRRITGDFYPIDELTYAERWAEQ